MFLIIKMNFFLHIILLIRYIIYDLTRSILNSPTVTKYRKKNFNKN